eukprot:13928567-Ditylum_brightwellii.AAC.1
MPNITSKQQLVSPKTIMNQPKIVPCSGKVRGKLAVLHGLVTGIRMFSIYRKYCADRVAGTYINNAGNAYVDESKQQVETPTSTRSIMLKIAQTWENLICGSGGMISANKTY